MDGLQTSGMIYFIIAMVVGFISFGFAIYKATNLLKDRRQTINYKEYAKWIIPCLVTFSVLFTLALLSIYIWNGYEATWQNYLQAIFGGLLFSASIGIGTISFIVHYYKKNLPTKLDKYLFYSLMIAIPVAVISFFLATDAFADMKGEHFILPNGISFSKGFVYPNEYDKPNIAFYAICILTGAVFVYFLCDHKLYLEYGKHGIVDATFLVAFPAGIVGARLAYVIGNWNRENFGYRVTHGEWWSIFAIWEGGLTILGGAIAGIIVGVLIYMKTNKGKSIWRAVDIIVPTILIAQAIGRWGNFFNCEVHGGLVPESYWGWLPRIVFNNAHFSSSGYRYAPDGYLFAPLFFIEFLVNLFGYFVLAHLFGIKLKKILAPGDLAFGYVIWYGFTRVFMEPLRDAAYNMGSDGYWSWFWSLLFVAGGTLLIATNHIVRYVLKEKNHQEASFSIRANNITISVLSPLGVGLLVSGIIAMCMNQGGLSIALNGFNIGVICVVTGISFLMLDAVAILELVYKLKNKKLGALDA